MKWLADENFPLASVSLLRKAGFDVAVVRDYSPGLSDTEVLAVGRAEHRGLVTFDRDFGELIFRRECLPPPALVYLRFVPTEPEGPGKIFLALLKDMETLEGQFVVLDRDDYRKRPLPRQEAS